MRKIFFEDTGLFFYIKECERFWEILNDVNLFRELISSDSIYEILSQFHLFPGAMTFFSDYSKFKGARSLLKRLEDNLYETNLEAVMYGNLNDSAKKKGLIGENEARVETLLRKKMNMTTSTIRRDCLSR